MKRIAAVFAALALTLLGVTLAPSAAFAATDVSGTVTEADGTTPIVGAAVSFLTSTGGLNAYTDASGHFSATPSPGTYTVLFSADGFASEYYDNTYLLASAATVTVADGVPLVLDASLEVESTITGTITNSANAPVVGGYVWAFTENNDWGSVPSTTTDANGNYTIHGLAPGNAKVYVETNSPGTQRITWYTTGYNEATATVIAVPAFGGTVNGDIKVPQGASIQGTVVDSIGTDVPLDIDVEATNGDGSLRANYQSGPYTIDGLHPDDYTVTTTDDSGLFADSAPQSATAVIGSPATVDFVVTPALVPESEFTTETAPVSGPTTVQAGKSYTWVVDDSGDTNVYAILYSSPVYLGAGAHTSFNTASLTLTIPASTPAGVHRFTYSSADTGKEGSSINRQYFDITVTAAEPLAATGVNALPIVVSAVVLLLLGGAAVLFARRRRARR